MTDVFDQDEVIEEHRTQVYDALDAALWTFQWSLDRANNHGEISLDRDEGRLSLHVNPQNSDDPDADNLSLIISRPVDLWEDPKDQIRDLIHTYLCHEADEQMWFDGERPFYPHNPDGSLK